MKELRKIGFGGGCHWCTEAVFQSINGVANVEQGFIASTGVHTDFSEAVVVHFSEDSISLKDIIAIHLHTHNSTSQHAMRNKYRSAVYVFSDVDINAISMVLESLQDDFHEKLITQVLPFRTFKSSSSQFHNYYDTDPERPFCKTHIHPKLQILKAKYPKHYCRENQVAIKK